MFEGLLCCFILSLGNTYAALVADLQPAAEVPQASFARRSRAHSEIDQIWMSFPPS